ncbi:MAG: hypothetical protein JWS12_921 [Candidatus Saccharibacteria bacterium]|nr:hypothetical protein [Candidatus Saccharibacteria bacterium]
MTAAQKDTIYIDVDDEITTIVEKVSSSDHKILALVLPKRAAMLQSIVNMKLLKRTADSEHKKVVLITSEAGLIPLAGAVGLYVAKNLQSKPLVPSGPSISDKIETIAAEEPELDASTDDAPLDPKRSVGDLAGLSAADAADDEVIEIDDQPDEAEATIPKSKKSKTKKPKVPNFNQFRLRLILGIAAFIILVVGWYLAFFVMPKAHIVLQTNTSNVNSSLSFTASPTATALDETKLILPAKLDQLKKDNSQKATATGQKDVGTKATGTATFATQTNCVTPVGTVPSGTTISATNLSFVTQETASFSPSGFQGGKCVFTSGAVPVVAQNAGEKYNLGTQSYTVNGYSSISGTGSDMTGGTSKVVTVVSQQDIDSAKQKIVDQGNSGAMQDLKNTLKTEGYMSIEDSFTSSDPAVTATPKVGEQAAEVTVTATTTYTLLGIKQADLKKIIDNDAKKQIDSSKQTILDEGLSAAVIQVQDKKGADTKLSVQTVVVAGPELNADVVRKSVAGKKKGDAKATLEARPGIKQATVTYSPFWVSKTPKKTSKISVIFEQSSTNATKK